AVDAAVTAAVLLDRSRDHPLRRLFELLLHAPGEVDVARVEVLAHRRTALLDLLAVGDRLERGVEPRDQLDESIGEAVGEVVAAELREGRVDLIAVPRHAQDLRQALGPPRGRPA